MKEIMWTNHSHKENSCIFLSDSLKKWPKFLFWLMKEIRELIPKISDDLYHLQKCTDTETIALRSITVKLQYIWLTNAQSRKSASLNLYSTWKMFQNLQCYNILMCMYLTKNCTKHKWGQQESIFNGIAFLHSSMHDLWSHLNLDSVSLGIVS